MSKLDLAVGSRVIVGSTNRKGEVKFIGETHFSSGEWIGIRLDQIEGKNDGSVGDVRYFECEPNRGLFVKRAQIKIDKDFKPEDNLNKRKSLSTTTSTSTSAYSSRKSTTGRLSLDTKQTSSIKSNDNITDATILNDIVIDRLTSENEVSNPIEKSESDSNLLLISSYEETIQSLKLEISTSQYEIKSLNNTIVKLNEEYELYKSDKEKELVSLDLQIQELNDNLEMLTLDKEQLTLDNEMLQESLESYKAQLTKRSSSSSTSDSTSINLSEENNKLREALKRLSDQTKKQLEENQHVNKELQSANRELNDLKKSYNKLNDGYVVIKEKNEELLQMVDSSSSYEDLIETLSMKVQNLETQVHELTLTNADLESSQELMEELDSSQRQEIDSYKKEIEKLEVSYNEKRNEIITLTQLLNETKQNNEKQKKYIESLKEEISKHENVLTSQNENIINQQQTIRQISLINFSKIENEKLIFQLKYEISNNILDKLLFQSINDLLVSFISTSTLYINDIASVLTVYQFIYKSMFLSNQILYLLLSIIDNEIVSIPFQLVNKITNYVFNVYLYNLYINVLINQVETINGNFLSIYQQVIDLSTFIVNQLKLIYESIDKDINIFVVSIENKIIAIDNSLSSYLSINSLTSILDLSINHISIYELYYNIVLTNIFTQLDLLNRYSNSLSNDVKIIIHSIYLDIKTSLNIGSNDNFLTINLLNKVNSLVDSKVVGNEESYNEMNKLVNIFDEIEDNIISLFDQTSYNQNELISKKNTCNHLIKQINHNNYQSTGSYITSNDYVSSNNNQIQLSIYLSLTSVCNNITKLNDSIINQSRNNYISTQRHNIQSLLSKYEQNESKLIQYENKINNYEIERKMKLDEYTAIFTRCQELENLINKKSLDNVVDSNNEKLEIVNDNDSIDTISEPTSHSTIQINKKRFSDISDTITSPNISILEKRLESLENENKQLKQTNSVSYDYKESMLIAKNNENIWKNLVLNKFSIYLRDLPNAESKVSESDKNVHKLKDIYRSIRLQKASSKIISLV